MQPDVEGAVAAHREPGDGAGRPVRDRREVLVDLPDDLEHRTLVGPVRRVRPLRVVDQAAITRLGHDDEERPGSAGREQLVEVDADAADVDVVEGVADRAVQEVENREPDAPRREPLKAGRLIDHVGVLAPERLGGEMDLDQLARRERRAGRMGVGSPGRPSSCGRRRRRRRSPCRGRRRRAPGRAATSRGPSSAVGLGAVDRLELGVKALRPEHVCRDPAERPPQGTLSDAAVRVRCPCEITARPSGCRPDPEDDAAVLRQDRGTRARVRSPGLP